MAKVITFSRRFPVTHPQKGKPTNFVDAIWENPSMWPGTVWLEKQNGASVEAIRPHITNFLDKDSRFPVKVHTIRAGQRHKAGDLFSPRVWAEGPYQSPQVKIAADTKIVKTWNISIDLCPDPEHDFLDIILINGKICLDTGIVAKLAKNDGLSVPDFRNWFKKPFIGQIICWVEGIEYE